MADFCPGAPPLPCSILQNPGKTLVLAVLLPVAALVVTVQQQLDNYDLNLNFLSKLKWLFLKYQPLDHNLTNSNSIQIKNLAIQLPKNKKLALNSRILTNQILTNDDEVCIPEFLIFLAFIWLGFLSRNYWSQLDYDLMASI